MKIFLLLLLLTFVFWTTTVGEVQNSEQENRFKLVNQRIRSLRDSVVGKLPTDSKKPKPVEPEDDDGSWNFGSFFGEFSTKMGLAVKNAVGDLLECVDNIFKCLRPGDDKKNKKKNENTTPKPKPAETVTLKPAEPAADGGKGSPATFKPASEKQPEAPEKPAEPVGGVANGVEVEIAPEKQIPVTITEKVDSPKANEVKPIEVDGGVTPKP